MPLRRNNTLFKFRYCRSPYCIGICLFFWILYVVLRHLSASYYYKTSYFTNDSLSTLPGLGDKSVEELIAVSIDGKRRLSLKLSLNHRKSRDKSGPYNEIYRRSVFSQGNMENVNNSTQQDYNTTILLHDKNITNYDSVTGQLQNMTTKTTMAQSTATTPKLRTTFTPPRVSATTLPNVVSLMRTNFDYIINQPDLCQQQLSFAKPNRIATTTSNNNDSRRSSEAKSAPYIVAYIHTSPTHFERRDVIRQSWADLQYSRQLGLVSVFLMGFPAMDKTFNQTMERLLQESFVYGDIVMADFLDSYWNLTLKNLAGLRWIQQHCLVATQQQQQRGLTYVLKVDDDVFVDTFRLVRYLRSVDIFYGNQNNQKKIDSESSSKSKSWVKDPAEELEQFLKLNSPQIVEQTKPDTISTQQTFFGYTYVKSRPVRTEHRKWFVSTQEYAGAMYPEYCAGAAYVHTTDVIEPLLNAAAKRPYLSIDDALITGILRVEIGARVQPWNELYRFTPKIPNCQFGADDNSKAPKSTSETGIKNTRTLGQCYISRRYVFIHLMKEASAMVEIWSKVLQRERPLV